MQVKHSFPFIHLHQSSTRRNSTEFERFTLHLCIRYKQETNMALKILRNDNTFTLEGQIDATTASSFQTHFNITLNTLENLTIDINKVTQIDAKGMNAFKVIYNNAKSWDKPFVIVGLGCKDVYEELLSIA